MGNVKGLRDINDIANGPLKRRRKYVPKGILEAKRLMEAGEFDESNPTHMHMKYTAERHGVRFDENP